MASLGVQLGFHFTNENFHLMCACLWSNLRSQGYQSCYQLNEWNWVLRSAVIEDNAWQVLAMQLGFDVPNQQPLI